MACSKFELMVPGICQDLLYRRVTTKSCHCNGQRYHPDIIKHLGFCDSHVHVDRLLTYNKIDYTNIAYPDGLKFMITNFIDPPFRRKQIMKMKETLQDPLLYGTIGIHPSKAVNYETEIDVVSAMLSYEKIVAIGECGLDLTKKHSLDFQEDCFIRQLELGMKHNKPVVIHCRDMQQETFHITKKYLLHNHKIHLHCFTGTVSDMVQWSEYFTHLKFGFTNKITHKDPGDQIHNNTYQQEVIKAIPLTKILLETDSPYFPVDRHYRYSLPGETITVARRIADLKEISVYTVLEQIMINTRETYGICGE